MKIIEIIILDEATEDLEAGKKFYNEREYGIGDYFIDSLLSDIASLKIYAGIHKKYFSFYRMLSKRFPFGIYYDIEGKKAIVSAILDMRMNPDTIQKIIKKR